MLHNSIWDSLTSSYPPFNASFERKKYICTGEGVQCVKLDISSPFHEKKRSNSVTPSHDIVFTPKERNKEQGLIVDETQVQQFIVHAARK